MLRSLHIENYVLIDSLDVSFPEGLSIITGATGAGKSILLGALGLLTGAKADASMISSGKSVCIVEGEFVSKDNVLDALLSDAGVEPDPDGTLIVRRMVYSSGRSRSFVNDYPVTLPVLSECAAHLVDIHSQHNNLILTDKRYQLTVLDLFAGNDSLLSECRKEWRNLQELRQRRDAVAARLASLREERSYNEARFRQLDEAHLVADELSALEAEQKQLANAESIKEALAGALAAFSPDEEQSVSSSLKAAEHLIKKVSGFVPSLGDIPSRIESARIELDDVRQSMEDAYEKVDVSGERLSYVEERMGLIYGLFQKFGRRTVAELITLRDEYSALLFDATSLEEEAGTLDAEIAQAQGRYSSVSDSLRESRVKAAPGFSKSIQDAVRFLELDDAVFVAEIIPDEPGPSGRDSVLFSFSSTGKAPQDVARCASGGEISRIMLCLKAQMARFTGMPTMIFDEIDTGVSGSAADKMGRMICDMGKDMQVLAITHLPQVAAKGNAHFVVTKSADKSSLHRVEGRDRVMEIARLLSAERITPEAVANAESLLG